MNTMSLEHIHCYPLSQQTLSTCLHTLPQLSIFFNKKQTKQNLLYSLNSIKVMPVFTGAGSHLLKHEKHIIAHCVFSQNCHQPPINPHLAVLSSKSLLCSHWSVDCVDFVTVI